MATLTETETAAAPTGRFRAESYAAALRISRLLPSVLLRQNLSLRLDAARDPDLPQCLQPTAEDLIGILEARGEDLATFLEPWGDGP